MPAHYDYRRRCSQCGAWRLTATIYAAEGGEFVRGPEICVECLREGPPANPGEPNADEIRRA